MSEERQTEREAQTEPSCVVRTALERARAVMARVSMAAAICGHNFIFRHQSVCICGQGCCTRISRYGFMGHDVSNMRGFVLTRAVACTTVNYPTGRHSKRPTASSKAKAGAGNAVTGATMRRAPEGSDLYASSRSFYYLTPPCQKKIGESGTRHLSAARPRMS